MGGGGREGSWGGGGVVDLHNSGARSRTKKRPRTCVCTDVVETLKIAEN